MSDPTDSGAAGPALAAERKAAWQDGLRAVSPGLLALAVWGLVTGVAMVKSGMSVFESVLRTLLVFAGSSQLAAIPLLVAGAPF